MSWRGFDEVKKIEAELQRKIYDILRDLVVTKKYKFHGISFSEVKLAWNIDRREADLVIMGPKPNDVFMIIETKRKEVAKTLSHVTDRAYIGQALSYAVLAKRKGLNVYFIAVCNPDAIAIYRVPEDVEQIVNWKAIEERRYEKVIPRDKYSEFLDPNKYAVLSLKLELKEEFFQKLLDDLVLIWKRIRKPIEIQGFTYKVIEDLRGFVNWLSWNIEPLIQRNYHNILKRHEEQIKRIGYEPSPKHLAREISYVFMNKIIFYKVLERFWGNLPELKPLYGRTINGVQIDSASKYLRELNKFFRKAIEVTKDFEPIFITGIYDEIILPDDPEVLRGIDAFIEYIDCISIERLGDVVGYIYEELIPERERHVLGQFYTPPAISELIVKWCIRTPDDVILGPGCGSGTFEVYGYKRLFELKTGKKYGEEYPSPEVHEKILGQIYALDINEFPTHLTAVNLAMRNPRAPSTKMNVFVADFFTIHPCVRTYIPYKVKAFGPQREVEKHIHVPKVDVVWGNPPYTRWMEIPKSTRNAIRKTLGSEMRRYGLEPGPVRAEPEIYIYWIMHATRFLKEGGRLGMIISNMWLQTDYGIGFGNFLLDHYKIKALIDISFRLFGALISNVIILAERCSNPQERNNNEVIFIHVPTRLEAKELDKVLSKIYDYLEGKLPSAPSGIIINKVKQSEIPRDKKWIRLFFPGVKEIVKVIEQHQLMIRVNDWFEPTRGNSVYSVWSLYHGARPDISPKDFFYLTPSKARQYDIPRKYLVPAITRAQWIVTYTFTHEDWKKLYAKDKEVYVFICHEPKGELPQSVRRYIEWGEPICPQCGARFISTQVDAQGYFTCAKGHRIPGSLKCITRVRTTRGGQRRGGYIASESEGSKAREKQGYPPFYGWYDLGGFIPTPIMAIRQAFYHPQFFLCKIPVVTYDAIVTFIPKVKLKTGFMEYDPEDYKRYLPEIKPDIVIEEDELKALMAYMNSTLNWIWVEQNGRRTGGGIIALEINIVRRMPILNIKAISKDDIKELSTLFDKLEENARIVIQTLPKGKRRKGSEEDTSGPKLEMIKRLRPIFREIDRKIAEILGIDIDVDTLWELAWQMMERRVKGAREVVRPGANEDAIVVRTKERKSEQTRVNSNRTLDEYFQR